jgi:hypothetical protein
MGLPGSAPEPNVAVLPSLPDGWQIVRHAILADGNLAIIGTDVDLRSEWRREGTGLVIGNPQRVAAAAQARIWVFDGSSTAMGPTFPLLTPFPMFDRFADGRWLVASSRALDEAKARILAAQGDELARIRVGDGIQHLKIDGRGRVWVGWFDEGVFGNDGWRVPGHEWPPSSYGLAAFDDAGVLVAHATDAPTYGGIADCYALNVTAERAWACTYTEFPILECTSEGGSRWWTTELSGPSAIAVDPPYVLAAGGYAENGNRLVLVRLDREQGETVSEWRLPIDLDGPNTANFIDGRGDQLHVVRAGSWYRWRIADFLAARQGT